MGCGSVLVHRYLPGLNTFTASVQGLVSWIMYSHTDNLAAVAVLSQKLLHSNSNTCGGYAALFCSIYRQACILSAAFFLYRTIRWCWEQLLYTGLKKTGKAKRWFPLVESGLKEPGNTQRNTTVFSIILSKPWEQTCTSYVCIHVKEHLLVWITLGITVFYAKFHFNLKFCSVTHLFWIKSELTYKRYDFPFEVDCDIIWPANWLFTLFIQNVRLWRG